MYLWTVDASDTVKSPNVPNTARKPSVIAAVAATARPTAIRRAAIAAIAHHQREVGGQHREAARVQRGHQSGGERQPDQVLLHSGPRLAASAVTRSCSSCCGMAEVGLFTNVDVPSAR